MAEYNLGTARGKIEIDAAGVRRGVSEATQEMEGFKGKLEQASPALKRTGAALMGLGAAALGGIGIAVKAAADFESELSKFKAVTGASTDEMELLRQKSLQIGRDTSFGAGQAAGAMVELGKAGLSTSDILEGAADATIALAEAGELDLARAAEIASATMAQFNLTAADSGKIADLLAGTANAAQGSVEDLGMALRNAGPMAGVLGISLEDTTAALGLLAQNGLTGARAGTALMATFRQLNPASQAAKDAMEELGIITEEGKNKFFDANGELKDLNEVSQILSESLSGLTDEQKQLALTTIFGSEGMAGAVQLANAGSEGFDEMAASIGKISAADVAAEKLNNLSGSMTILKGTIETALIGVGSPLQDVLKGIVDGVTSAINAFASMPESMQKFIGVGLIVVGLIGTLGGAFLLLLGFLPAIIAGFGTFTGVILPIVAPILAVVAAVGLLVAGLVILYQRSQTFRDIVAAAWAEVQSAIQSATATVLAIFDKIKLAWTVLVGLFQRDSMAEEVSTQMGTVGQILQNLVQVFRSAMDAISAIVKWVVEQIQNFWDRFGTHIMAAAERFLGNIKTFFERTWSNVKQIFEGVTRALIGVFEIFAGIFTGDWSRFWGGVQKLFSGIWAAILGIFKQVWNMLQTAFKMGFEVLRTVIGAAMAAISQIWSGAWHAIATFLSNIWNEIVAAIKGKIEESVAEFRAFKEKVKEAFSAAKDWLISAGKDIIRGLINGIKDMAGRAKDAALKVVEDAVGGVMSFLGMRSPSKLFAEMGEDMVKGMEIGILSNAGLATAAVVDLMDGAIEEAQSALGAFTSGFSAFRGKDRAQADLAKAEEKLAELRKRNRKIPGDIARAERDLAAARTEAEKITPEEEMAVLRARENLRRASEALQEEYAAEGASTDSIRMKQLELNAAEAELARIQNEVVAPTNDMIRKKEEELKTLREEQKSMSDSLKQAEEALQAAQLGVVEAEMRMLEAGQKLIDQGPEGEAMFRALAEQAGLTKSSVDALIGSYAQLNAAIGGATGAAVAVGAGAAQIAVEKAVRSVHSAGSTVDPADIQAALRAIGHDFGKRVDQSDLDVLLAKTGTKVEQVNLNGNLVLPNITNASSADDLLSGLRQAARRN